MPEGAVYYAQLWTHRAMLSDEVRCEAFRRAIDAAVKPGSVVLDVGTGTGLLAIFAARAGARKVYAVERTGIAAFARDLVSQIGLDSIVEVREADIVDVELPEKVDVIVSEWMGGYGIDEGFLPAVLVARDRWLAPGGVLIPETVDAWIAPVFDELLEMEVDFFRNSPYQIDMAAVAADAVNEVHYARHHINAASLASQAQRMWSTDVSRDPLPGASQPFEASLTFPVTRAARINGLAAWFHASLGNGITLTNAPEGPPTHWGRFLFPLDSVADVQPGTSIDLRFIAQPRRETHCATTWSVRFDGGEWEEHYSAG
jgi:protein arginine N-methyltransferase 1